MDDLTQEGNPFDAETWALLPDFFEQLPEQVQINVWGDPSAGFGEHEAVRIAKSLAARFSQIEAAFFPRRANYPYYPVIGVFERDGEEAFDRGVRIIGLPSGYQITSLIAAIQAVSFHGTTIEATTRIQLQSLDKEVKLELLTAANDEAGAVLAKTAFGLAAACPYIRTYLIMTDTFPIANMRYSVSYLPHLVINGRMHVESVVEEDELLKKIAKALK